MKLICIAFASLLVMEESANPVVDGLSENGKPPTFEPSEKIKKVKRRFAKQIIGFYDDGLSRSG